LDACFRIAKCPYPLPADWSEKATAAYQAFRVEYEQLLNSAGQPLKTVRRRKLAGKTMDGTERKN
jgi:hypothetical protein